MLNLNTICCFCCRGCGWMRYCFCLPKLRKWNKGGNSRSARRRGGDGLEGVLSPHSRPFFATNPYPELLSSFSWKPFSFPISGGSTEGPPLYLVQTEARKKIAFETPPPLIWKSGSATARQYPCGDFGESHFPSGVLIRDLENILPDPGNSIS